VQSGLCSKRHVVPATCNAFGGSPQWVITLCVDLIRMGGAAEQAFLVSLVSCEEGCEGVHRMLQTQQGQKRWREEALRTSAGHPQGPVFRGSIMRGV
jgi:hypothetical protein